MSYEVYLRASGLPEVKFHPGGRIEFNNAALHMVGCDLPDLRYSPERVVLLYDRDSRKVGFHMSGPTGSRGFQLSAHGLVNAPAFIQWAGIDVEEVISCEPYTSSDPDMLEVKLPGRMALETAINNARLSGYARGELLGVEERQHALGLLHKGCGLHRVYGVVAEVELVDKRFVYACTMCDFHQPDIAQVLRYVVREL